MPTRISEYYHELQRCEALNPVQLVAEWAQDDTDAVALETNRPATGDAYIRALLCAQRVNVTLRSAPTTVDVATTFVFDARVVRVCRMSS